MSESRIFYAENWRLEAVAVINDIKNHVKFAEIVNGTDRNINLNLTTKEGEDYNIELSNSGFRIVGSDEYFETPYSLLISISPLFQQSFGNELLEKLNSL